MVKLTLTPIMASWALLCFGAITAKISGTRHSGPWR